MVNIFISSRYKIDYRSLKQEAELLLLNKGCSPEQTLNIIFVGKNKMRQIARQYKKEDVALPVLSFSYQSSAAFSNQYHNNNDDKFIGEIYICYPQSVLLAAERNKKVDVILKQLIKHGIENIVQ
jgi:rRNA maturation RNase YbeY